MSAASIGAKAPHKLIGAASRTGGFAVASMQRAVHLRRNYPEAPMPAPNLARLATVFAEELMLLTAATTDSRVRDAAVLRRISEETDEALALFDANGWLDDPASYHQTPDAPADFDLETQGFRPSPVRTAVVRQRLPAVAGHARCRAVARRWRPTGAATPMSSNTPTVRGRGSCSSTAPVWARRSTCSCSAPSATTATSGSTCLRQCCRCTARERTRADERANVASIDWVANVHSLTQIVWDLRRCLAWIRGRGAPSIAVHGMSLGGYATALLSGLDADLGCVIAGVPAATIHRPLISVYTHNPSFRKALEQHDLIGDRVEALHSVITPTSLACVVPHERRFIYAGIADRLVTPNEPYLLWEHWNRPSIYWTQQSHVLTMLSPNVRTFVREAVIGSATARSSLSPGRVAKPAARRA